MKRKIITLLSIVTLIGSIPALNAFAADADKGGISGGWSESTGYYVNGVSGTADTYTYGTPVVQGLKVMTRANQPSPTPDKHTGKRLTKIVDNGGTTAYAAFGETLWYYKYHYTTARMELSNGTVKTTSGRQWGMNATKATSPYYFPDVFDNTEARTYWGS